MGGGTLSHNTDYLRVHGKRIRLSQWDPRSTKGCTNREAAVERTAQCMAQIDKLQYRLYGEAKRSLLCAAVYTRVCTPPSVISHPPATQSSATKAVANNSLLISFIALSFAVSP